MDFNGNGKKEPNEELGDADEDGKIGSEFDYYDFIGNNYEHISLALKTRTIEPLIKALGNKSDKVRETAANTLGKLSKSNIPVALKTKIAESLIKALGDNSWSVRHYAAGALGLLAES
ncbi:MAG: hypothetical protein ABIA67_05100, partial [Candidatus Margulisiibacteriota bacterium]